MSSLVQSHYLRYNSFERFVWSSIDGRAQENPHRRALALPRRTHLLSVDYGSGEAGERPNVLLWRRPT